MPSSSLALKLKLKPGSRAGIVNAPDGYTKELGALPAGVELVDKLSGTFDWLQIFVKNKSEVDKIAPRATQALKPESILWISFPKGTSKIQTDLTRDKGWNVLKGKDLKWITLVSVNETWSAFAVRPYREGEERRSFR
jgi:hypothetical protein